MDAQLKAFVRDRDAALLSLDEQRIRAYMRKWNGSEMTTNMPLFWGAVHKAITGAGTLPREFRQKSKAWLEERGLQSHDDGDL